MEAPMLSGIIAFGLGRHRDNISQLSYKAAPGAGDANADEMVGSSWRSLTYRRRLLQRRTLIDSRECVVSFMA